MQDTLEKAALKQAGLTEFRVTREFRVIARNQEEAQALLEQELNDMRDATLALKQIVAAAQENSAMQAAVASERAAMSMPGIDRESKKDYGPN